MLEIGMQDAYAGIAVLVPAYEPDEKLPALIRELAKLPFARIFVIDDGSSSRCEAIFEEAKRAPRCTVIRHPHNQGKGAALKTGLRAIEKEALSACITVDADGQHLPEDVQKIAAVIARHPDTLVLGSRDFSGPRIPLRSRWGNIITRTVFTCLTGKKITDTQTGLRAIPRDAMPRLQTVPGDRYEFEMNMLINAAHSDMPVLEVPIHTVYLDANRASHFKPLRDSANIYKQLLKFNIASLLSFIVDILLFALTLPLFEARAFTRPLLAATLAARAVSSLLNFSLNKKLVFNNHGRALPQILKYYALCLLIMLASGLALEAFTALDLTPVILLKIFIDASLFLLSFLLQRRFIFPKKHPRETFQSIS